MAEADNTAMGATLADLADLDVSDIQEIRFEQLPEGIYDFIIKDPNLGEGTKDDEKIFVFTAKLEVEEVVSLIQPGGDPEKLVGKVHNHRQNIELTDLETGIGRVRAFITDVGQDSSGKMGEAVERIRDHRFRGKIVHQKDRTDPSVVYARLRFDKPKS